MHCTALRNLFRYLPFIILTACAAPMSQVGSVSRVDVQNEQYKQQQLVITSQLALQQRLDNVGYPLLKAALSLCGKDVRQRSGVMMQNASVFDKDYQTAARMLGYTDTVTVVGVIKGSPAERAGVAVGDRVVSFAGSEVVPGRDAIAEIGKRFAVGFGPGQLNGKDRAADAVMYTFSQTTLPVTLRRDSSNISKAIPLEPLCGYELVAVKSDELNAWADGSKVYVTSAMMRFTDDAELATVVSHEIGHDAMHHMDAKKRNALLGGLFGAVLDVASAAGGVNTGGRYTNQMAALGSQQFSQDFEREADYVGMYILARADENYSGAATVWRHMATESPGSIKMATTHPTTAERFVRLEQITTEIDQKKAAGEPLMPDMKKK